MSLRVGHRPTRQNDLLTAEQHRIKHRSVVRTAILCVSIITIFGTEALRSRSACQLWDLELADEEQEFEHAKRTAIMEENTYLDRAQLNCEWDFDQNPSFSTRNPEIVAFCLDYSKDKIPSIWAMDSALCEAPEMRTSHRSRVPGMPLTCYAKQARKTKDYFEEVKARLINIVAQQPLLCIRGKE